MENNSIFSSHFRHQAIKLNKCVADILYDIVEKDRHDLELALMNAETYLLRLKEIVEKDIDDYE